MATVNINNCITGTEVRATIVNYLVDEFAHL